MLSLSLHCHCHLQPVTSPKTTDGPCRTHRKGLGCRGCHHLSGMTELPTASRECHAPTSATTSRRGRARPTPGTAGILHRSARGETERPHTHSPSSTALPATSPPKFPRKTPYGERRERPEPSRALRGFSKFFNRAQPLPQRPRPARPGPRHPRPIPGTPTRQTPAALGDIPSPRGCGAAGTPSG